MKRISLSGLGILRKKFNVVRGFISIVWEEFSVTSFIGSVLLFSVFLCLCGIFFNVSATIPLQTNLQGRLTNKAGSTLTGNYDFAFRIYDDATTGNMLWNESQTGIAVSNGIYNVILGSASAIGTGVFDGNNRWLQIEVNTEPMLPRLKLISVPYAYVAERAYGVIGTTITTSNIVNGAVTNAKINDVAPAKISTGTLNSNVIASSISANSVGTAQIADGTIAESDIGNGQVTTIKLKPTVSTTAANSDITLTGTPQTVSGTTVNYTPTTNQKLMAYGVFDFDVISASGVVVIGELYVNGATQSGQALFIHATPDRQRATVSQVWAVDLDSGTPYTIELRAYVNVQIGISKCMSYHTKLLQWFVSR